MAVGDLALAAGMAIVPDTDMVGDGYEEINRTRDYLATATAGMASSKAAARANAGISSGTAEPSGGNDGDIYFKILS